MLKEPECDPAERARKVRDHCGQCAPIVWLQTHEEPLAFEWECRICSSSRKALILRNTKDAVRRNLRPRLDSQCEVRLLTSDSGTGPLVDQIVLRQQNHSDRRGAKRYLVSAGVPVATLDSALSPTGDIFRMVMRDISTTGIALLHHQDVPVFEAVIQLARVGDNSPLQLLARIIRKRKIGALFEYGAQFDHGTP